MDHLLGLRGLLDTPLDVPLRVVGSSLAIVGVCAAWTQSTPLEAIAHALAAVGLAPAAEAVIAVTRWSADHHGLLVAGGLTSAALGLAFAYRGGRPAAAALIGLVALLQAGGVMAWVALGMLSLLPLAWIASRLFERPLSAVLDDPSRHTTGACLEIVAAVVYAPVAPLRWLLARG